MADTLKDRAKLTDEQLAQCLKVGAKIGASAFDLPKALDFYADNLLALLSARDNLPLSMESNPCLDNNDSFELGKKIQRAKDLPVVNTLKAKLETQRISFDADETLKVKALESEHNALKARAEAAEKALCPPGYTYETYIRKLEGGLIKEERKVLAGYQTQVASQASEIDRLKRLLLNDEEYLANKWDRTKRFPNTKLLAVIDSKLKAQSSVVAPAKEGG